MSRVLLEANSVTVRRGGRDRLMNASLALEAGEVVAIVGPNGAGKSTFLKAIAGELKIRQGSVDILGRPLDDWDPRELARVRGVLPQESSLSFPFTALEVVLMGRAPHIGRNSRAQDEEIALDALERVGLGHAAERLYPTLSGGERQRVQFARVLAQLAGAPEGEAQALLLDEPTSNLDLEHQHTILRVAKELCGRGLAVMAILHDLDLASTYADRLLLLQEGRVAAEGEPWEVLTEELVSQVFSVRATVLKHPHADRPLVVTG